MDVPDGDHRRAEFPLLIEHRHLCRVIPRVVQSEALVAHARYHIRFQRVTLDNLDWTSTHVLGFVMPAVRMVEFVRASRMD